VNSERAVALQRGIIANALEASASSCQCMWTGVEAPLIAYFF
jgi:hypothetical protein